MAGTFRSTSLHKVDGKGRVSIPALFRRVLEDSDPDRASGNGPGIIINHGDQLKGYVECYTVEAAAEIDRMIKAKPIGSQDRKMLVYLMQTQSVETQVDDDGRLVLAKILRDKAGLVDEALFVGRGDTFQIWNPAAFEAQEANRARDWLAAQGDDFDPLSLLGDVM